VEWSKNISVILLFLVFSPVLSTGQLSYFSWDANPVTNADVGPNATIKSGSPATSIAATYNGTNGLSANEVGTSGNSVGIDLDIDVSDGSFDVNGIDISISFQREENRGDFVTRGNEFVMGMNGGSYYVEFSLKDGSGGSTLVQSGNIFSIPNDNTFRRYRFTYNQNTGIAEASVDGTVVWTHVAADYIREKATDYQRKYENYDEVKIELLIEFANIHIQTHRLKNIRQLKQYLNGKFEEEGH